MAKNPLVSVIVPVYNVSRYLDKCVSSITQQTYGNLEIFLINDGSTDESPALCRAWKSRDPRITVIDQKNQGVSVARNSGLDSCAGEWICFVDGDDWLEPDAVEKMLAAVSEDTDVLITDYFVDSETKSWTESFFSLKDHDFAESERLELIKNCYLKTSFSNRSAVTMVGVPWAKLFRTQVLKEKEIRFDPGLRKMQDALFCSEFFQNCTRVRFRAFPTYHYRQNSASVTHKGNAGYQKVADSVLKALWNFIEKYGYEEELLPVYYARKFMFAFESVKFIYILDETGMSLGDKIQGVRSIMSGLDLKEHEESIKPYLGKAHRIAFALYKMKAYRLMYFMMVVYYRVKMWRRG